tara:strand:+ start:145 stop:396 length:252 start_codon:yes stop_codon:yes gene_type:complete
MSTIQLVENEFVDQELSLTDLEDVTGGSFGIGVLVGAWMATIIIGMIAAEKAGMPGSTKSAFGRRDNQESEDELSNSNSGSDD